MKDFQFTCNLRTIYLTFSSFIFIIKFYEKKGV